MLLVGSSSELDNGSGRSSNEESGSNNAANNEKGASEEVSRDAGVIATPEPMAVDAGIRLVTSI